MTLANPAAFEIEPRAATAATAASPTVARDRLAIAVPIALGGLMVLAAVLLVMVEFGFPARDVWWKGIRFSNTVNSSGARHIVSMFRERLDWMPGPNASNPLSPREYLYGLRIAWGGMFLIQILAILATWRLRPVSPWLWVVGPVATAFVLLFYPPTSTDIYAYASFGWVADEGGNPYVTAPEMLSGDPFAVFNDWTHITTPYGPLWTVISQALVHLSGGDPLVAGFLFKISTTLFAFALAFLVYRLAGRVTTDQRLRLVALVIVLWSPILLTESTGTVHLDAPMMMFALAGLLVATSGRRGSWRAGLMLVTLSTLVKPATLPLLGLMGLFRFMQPEPMRKLVPRVVGDALLVIGVTLAAYLPYFDGNFFGSVNKMAHDVFIDRPMRSNPLWAWAINNIDIRLRLSDYIPGDAGTVSRWLAILGAVVMTWITVQMARRNRADMMRIRGSGAGVTADFEARALRGLILIWAVVAAIIGIVPLNAHAWYAIWSLGPLAVLAVSDGMRDRLRPPAWIMAIYSWTAISFMIYHTLQKR